MNPFINLWDKFKKKSIDYGFFNNITPGIVGNKVEWMPDNLSTYLEKGYSANDVLYSICQITGEKIKIAPWNAYKIVDEKALKQMKALQREGGNYKKILDLHTKALELYEADGRLNELLQWPNEMETFPELVAHSSIAKMITGNRFIEATILEFGVNGGKPIELNRLPSQFMKIKGDGLHPLGVAGFTLMLNGKDIPLTKESVMHDKYYNTGFELWGQSPVKAARNRLTMDNSATEAATKSYQNMGPGHIVFSKDQRMNADQSEAQMGALKKAWIENNTGTNAAKKITLSGYEVGGYPLGLSPVDLAIIEQQKWNLISFCNIWNFPHLMLMADNATDNNVGWAERALTQRCALPLMTSFRSQFNRKLQMDWGYKDKNIYIDFDQSVYAELDVNRKDQAEWMRDQMLTIRQRYELLNIEIPEQVEKEYGDKLDRIYVSQNLVDLSEIGLPEINEEI